MERVHWTPASYSPYCTTESSTSLSMQECQCHLSRHLFSCHPKFCIISSPGAESASQWLNLRSVCIHSWARSRHGIIHIILELSYHLPVVRCESKISQNDSKHSSYKNSRMSAHPRASGPAYQCWSRKTIQYPMNLRWHPEIVTSDLEKGSIEYCQRK